MSESKIWKYTLKLVDDVQHVLIPFGAEILTCQMQNDIICLWARHCEIAEDQLQDCKFKVYGTGEIIPNTDQLRMYMGTVQQNGFVWHIYALN